MELNTTQLHVNKSLLSRVEEKTQPLNSLKEKWALFFLENELLEEREALANDKGPFETKSYMTKKALNFPLFVANTHKGPNDEKTKINIKNLNDNDWEQLFGLFFNASDEEEYEKSEKEDIYAFAIKLDKNSDLIKYNTRLEAFCTKEFIAKVEKTIERVFPGAVKDPYAFISDKNEGPKGLFDII